MSFYIEAYALVKEHYNCDDTSRREAVYNIYVCICVCLVLVIKKLKLILLMCRLHVYVFVCITQPKVQSPGGAKRIDPPSDNDLKYGFHSLTSDPRGRKDSKVCMFALVFIIYKIKCSTTEVPIK